MSDIVLPVVGGEKGTVPVCTTCGSHLVMHDAWANWNPSKGTQELGAVFDATFCDVCGGETTLDWLTEADWATRRIRALNDTLRQTGPTLPIRRRTLPVPRLRDSLVRMRTAVHLTIPDPDRPYLHSACSLSAG